MSESIGINRSLIQIFSWTFSWRKT